LNANDIQLRVGETMKDTGHVLSRFLDAIMIRTYAQATWSTLPPAPRSPSSTA